MQFEKSDLAALDRAKEVEVETRSAAGVVHRTIVWVVVHAGEVYLRSYLGPEGRWYREALADPSVALHVDGRRLPAVAIHTPDPASVEACSAGLRAKYRPSASRTGMLVDAVLPTTLRLVPA